MTRAAQLAAGTMSDTQEPNLRFGIGPSNPLAWDCLVPALEAQAQATPGAPALWYQGETIAYEALHARANQLARRLQEMGIVRGDRVALVLQRGVDAIVAILSVLKAGASYVPIDLAYPSARIRYIVEDSGARLAIIDADADVRLPDGFPSLNLGSERARIAALSPDPLQLEYSAVDPIYVIYTSGSTGQPKGAAVSHRSFSNLLQWYISELALSRSDSTLLVSALGFDLTQKNIFAPLLVGGTLNIPATANFDPEYIIEIIERRGVTFVNCTPSSFMPLLEGPAAERHDRLSSLRWVVLGGEPIPVARLLPWLQDARCRARILNSYGPTECTDICAVWPFDGASALSPAPLGRPIDNAVLAVLDGNREPTLLGEEGELWIGGMGVGLGYLGRPALNAEKFVTLDVHGVPTRMYRSGDRVRWRENGLLEFLGRVDHQVKLRGHRLELGEVEAALMSHDSVREAVALVREVPVLGDTLVAYLVVRPGCGFQDEAVRRHLEERLPSVMVPSRFVRLAAMPMSPNGKVDRGALPLPEPAAPAFGTDPTLRSESHTEKLIRETWIEVLGHVPAGTERNFFDLGGTSLGAAKVQAGLQRRLGRDVSIVTLFAYPTIAALARHLDASAQPGSLTLVPVRVTRQAQILQRLRGQERAR